ncbi:conjugative transposon protein TraM [Chryseolinea lacunae]|uniref:Conjugative transposon protein TraM n=1 Tax=Chryseolinea lacunae TaxID=2801331 RepID=A0ABS1L043_9BACT|nr:conjugative transposon protein TraM [Chryseolinea lacunae]MBL0744867.1 conjugative transposon protein TraM [Chryseolinea lacunae]
MKTHSQKFLQQRRFYMVLPLLAFPFITMIFWALGGGQGTPVKAETVTSGLNFNLPGAHFEKEDELWDKFTLYEQARRDSIKYDEARRNDPYYVVATLHGSAPDTVPDKTSRLNTSLGQKDRYHQISTQEALINSKIEQLTRQIAEPQSLPEVAPETSTTSTIAPREPSDNSDVTRLETMMQMMASPGEGDPEMQQIEGVLEKILDIQHPERIADKIKTQRQLNQTHLYEVEAAQEEDNITLVEKDIENDSLGPISQRGEFPESQNAFYGLDEYRGEHAEDNAIQAVIHGTQTVVAGSTIKMRLLSDVFINGHLIKKDQFIYGVCSIAGERLVIGITSIRDENSLFPVALKVFDLDGLDGIYIPGAITRDAAKQATSQSIQGIQLNSLDNSLGVQAATAGIEAAKGLFSKKAKLIKISVKAGYHILIKDANQKPS